MTEFKTCNNRYSNYKTSIGTYFHGTIAITRYKTTIPIWRVQSSATTTTTFSMHKTAMSYDKLKDEL